MRRKKVFTSNIVLTTREKKHQSRHPCWIRTKGDVQSCVRCYCMGKKRISKKMAFGKSNTKWKNIEFLRDNTVNIECTTNKTSFKNKSKIHKRPAWESFFCIQSVFDIHSSIRHLIPILSVFLSLKFSIFARVFFIKNRKFCKPKIQIHSSVLRKQLYFIFATSPKHRLRRPYWILARHHSDDDHILHFWERKREKIKRNCSNRKWNFAESFGKFMRFLHVDIVNMCRMNINAHQKTNTVKWVHLDTGWDFQCIAVQMITAKPERLCVQDICWTLVDFCNAHTHIRTMEMQDSIVWWRCFVNKKSNRLRFCLHF